MRMGFSGGDEKSERDTHSTGWPWPGRDDQGGGREKDFHFREGGICNGLGHVGVPVLVAEM